MAINKLTAKFCENAPVGNHFDGSGLYLLVRPDGKRYWHMVCNIESKRKLLSLGAYPKVSLEKARKAHKEKQQLIQEGINPVQQKKEKVLAQVQEREKIAQEAGNTFEQLARKLCDSKAGDVTEHHLNKILRQFELHVFPHIGHKHIMDIKGGELLELFQKVAKKKNHGRLMTYLARSLCQLTAEVFDFAYLQNNDFSINPYRAFNADRAREFGVNVALLQEYYRVRDSGGNVDAARARLEQDCMREPVYEAWVRELGKPLRWLGQHSAKCYAMARNIKLYVFSETGRGSDIVLRDAYLAATGREVRMFWSIEAGGHFDRLQPAVQAQHHASAIIMMASESPSTDTKMAQGSYL